MRWGERNRARLRAWLPCVDSTRTLEDRKNLVRGTLEQFAANNGFQASMWHEGRLSREVARRVGGRTAWLPPTW
jgi:hypothetical protein